MFLLRPLTNGTYMSGICGEGNEQVAELCCAARQACKVVGNWSKGSVLSTRYSVLSRKTVGTEVQWCGAETSADFSTQCSGIPRMNGPMCARSTLSLPHRSFTPVTTHILTALTFSAQLKFYRQPLTRYTARRHDDEKNATSISASLWALFHSSINQPS
jgi:hypothetical protein